MIYKSTIIYLFPLYIFFFVFLLNFLSLFLYMYLSFKGVGDKSHRPPGSEGEDHLYLIVPGHTLLSKVLWPVVYYFRPLRTLYLLFTLLGTLRCRMVEPYESPGPCPSPLTPSRVPWGTQLFLDFRSPLVPSVSGVLSHGPFSSDVSLSWGL